jgi:hypothetical protein
MYRIFRKMSYHRIRIHRLDTDTRTRIRAG